MIFTSAPLQGAHVIELLKHEDDRGFFARTFCRDTFKKHGLESDFLQQNMSRTSKKHTLRGMHFQKSPDEEVKVIRCIKGAILDVIIDLNQGSPTYLRHFAIELSDANHKQLYVPKGFAHGFMSLTNDVQVSYLVSTNYAPNSESGIRWNDPKFAINWPTDSPSVSQKDQEWPDFL